MASATGLDSLDVVARGGHGTLTVSGSAPPGADRSLPGQVLGTPPDAAVCPVLFTVEMDTLQSIVFAEESDGALAAREWRAHRLPHRRV